MAATDTSKKKPRTIFDLDREIRGSAPEMSDSEFSALANRYGGDDSASRFLSGGNRSVADVAGDIADQNKVVQEQAGVDTSKYSAGEFLTDIPKSFASGSGLMASNAGQAEGMIGRAAQRYSDTAGKVLSRSPVTATTRLLGQAVGKGDEVNRLLDTAGSALVSGAGKAIEKLEKPLKDIGKTTTGYWTEKLSKPGKQLKGTSFYKAGGLGNMAMSAALQAAESAPETVAIGLAGGPVASGLEKAGFAKGMVKALRRAGVSKKLAPGIASWVEEGISYGSMEGIDAGLSNANQVGQDINRMTHDDLMKSPAYKKYFEKTGSEKEAKRLLIEDAEAMALGATAVLSTATGAIAGGGLFDKTLTSKHFLLNRVLGGVKEANQEFWQSGIGEALPTNLTMKKAKPDQKAMQGVWEQGLAGAGPGAVMGIFGGSAHQQQNLPEKSPAVANNRAILDLKKANLTTDELRTIRDNADLQAEHGVDAAGVDALLAERASDVARAKDILDAEQNPGPLTRAGKTGIRQEWAQSVLDLQQARNRETTPAAGQQETGQPVEESPASFNLDHAQQLVEILKEPSASEEEAAVRAEEIRKVLDDPRTTPEARKYIIDSGIPKILGINSEQQEKKTAVAAPMEEEWRRQEQAAMAYNRAKNRKPEELTPEMLDFMREYEKGNESASMFPGGPPAPVEQVSDEEYRAFRQKWEREQKKKRWESQRKAYEKSIKRADEISKDTSIPKEVRIQARKEAEDIVNSDPVYQHMAEAKKRGRLNLEMAREAYDSDTVRQISMRYPGIFSRVGRLNPDEFANEMGYSSLDEMIQRFSHAKTKKELTADIISQRNDEWQQAEDEWQQLAEESKQRGEWTAVDNRPATRKSNITFPAPESDVAALEELIRRTPVDITEADLSHWTFTAEQKARLRKVYRESIASLMGKSPATVERGKYDSQEKRRLARGESQGNEPGRTVQEKEAGAKTPEAGGVLQTLSGGRQAVGEGVENVETKKEQQTGQAAQEGQKVETKGATISPFKTRTGKDRILITGYPSSLNDSLKAIPGSRMNKTRKGWTFPAHQEAAVRNVVGMPEIGKTKAAVETPAKEQPKNAKPRKKLTKRQAQVMEWLNRGSSFKDFDASPEQSLDDGYIVPEKVISALERKGLIEFLGGYGENGEWYSTEIIERDNMRKINDRMLKEKRAESTAKRESARKQSNNKRLQKQGVSEKTKGKKYGKSNKIFTEDAAEKARALLKSKLGQLNTGLDPEMMQAGITLAGYHIEAGARKFADYAKAMVNDLGEGIRPFLRSFYEGVRYYPGLDNTGMSSREEIDRYEKEQQGPEPKKKPTMEEVEVFNNKETGMAGRVYRNNDTGNYHVTLLDVDSGNVVPGAAIFKDKGSAIEKAKEWAGIQGGKNITEGQFRKSLERKGTAVDAAGRNFSIQQNENGSYYVRYVENGIRHEKGPGHPAKWSMETAREKAVEMAQLAGQGKAASATIKERRKKNVTRTEDTDRGRPDRVNLHGMEQEPQGSGSDRNNRQEAQGGGRGRTPADTGIGGTGRNVRAGGNDRGKGRTVQGRPDRVTIGASEGQKAGNYHLSEEEIFAIEKRPETRRVSDNLEAIRTLKKLQSEGRKATAEEQATLARWSGWGGLIGIFNEKSSRFEKQRQELKELLSDDEYAAARSSSRTAHYTSPTVINAIYNALRRLGVSGQKKILEPSVGVGNFLGLLPSFLKPGTVITGVELDNITGGIAKYLYPDANIVAPVGFQDVSLKEGSFDVVVGNPPFNNTPVRDRSFKAIGPDGKPLKQSLHNFFFAKSLHATRPGGIMAMVVTHRVMDKKDPMDRAYLARHAELIGAIRLPDTAFLGNTGTSVTTDILFFKKRKEPLDWDQAREEMWVKTGTVQDPDGGEVIPLNRYFIDHPDMMLGSMTRKGTMYRANQATLTAPAGQDLESALVEAVGKLPVDIYEKRDNTATNLEAVKADPDIPPGTKVHGYFISKDGTLKQRNEDIEGQQQSGPATKFVTRKGKAVEVELQGREAERAKGMVKVRDALNVLIDMESTAPVGDRELERARRRLNRVYDSFVGKYGYAHAPGNRHAFRRDPDYPRLLALEEDYRKAISNTVAKKHGINPRKASARKADIFTERVIMPERDVKRVESAKDALSISLNESGAVDIGRMSELVGKAEDDVIRELGDLIYNDPSRGWVTADQYLSGNVKAKLTEARAAAKKKPEFQRNVEALEKVQPADIEPVDISVPLSSPWLPADVLDSFANHLLGTGFKGKYNRMVGGWIGETTGSGVEAKAQQWRTEGMSGAEILTRLITGKQIKVWRKDADGNRVIDIDATQEANAKADEIKQEFSEWIWEGGTREEAARRRKRLGRIYNDTYNTNIIRKHDGSHLTFPGMVEKMGGKPFALREHQRNAIWRSIQDGRVLLDHVVGAGKTFTMIATAMEMKRMGLLNKPMFVVPNHLIEQWAADFYKLYPGAKLLAATKQDFSKQNRQHLFSRIATGNWDAVIVAHSSFGKILSPADETKAYLEEQVEQYRKAIEAMKENDVPKSIVRQAENFKDKLHERIKKIQERQDDVIDFGHMGVDAVFVDEAHEFKNLGFATKQGNIPGLGTRTGSQKADDLFIKSRIIQKRNGGRGVYFATGTPVSNTLAEMFTMQRYLDFDNLNQMGVSSFDAWADVFADTITKWELDATGVNYKQTTRFAKFVNLDELMRLYMSFADVISQQHLIETAKKRGKRWPIPKIKGGKPQQIVVPRSDLQAAYMDYVVYRAENMDPKDRRKDNMLKLTTDATKAALDMRLIDPNAQDDPNSKPNRAVQEIYRIYEEWNDRKGTQLVFLDYSAPKKANAKAKREYQDLVRQARQGDEKARAKLDKMTPADLAAMQSGFSVYDDMKAKLIAMGIPENEIAFIHDANTDKQKAELLEKVRSGAVRVLFGSTAKMGAGMNVQNKLVALHHIDAPWRPSDLEQREGRILRQGNEFYLADQEGFEVVINRYATKETYDARRWQIIEGKALVVESLRNYDPKQGMREVEDVGGEAANAAEMKAAASGDPLIAEQVELNGEIKMLEGLKRSHQRKKQRMEGELELAKRALQPGGEIERVEKFSERLRTEADRTEGGPFSAVINGVEFTPPAKPDTSGMSKKEKKAALKAYENAVAKNKKDATRAMVDNVAQRTKADRAPWHKMGSSYRGMTMWLKVYDKGVFSIAALPDGTIPEDVPWELRSNVEFSYNQTNKFSGTGLFTRIDNMLHNFQGAVQDQVAELKGSTEEQVAALEQNIPGDFPKNAELEKKRKRFKEIMKILGERKTTVDDPFRWRSMINGGIKLSKPSSPLPSSEQADVKTIVSLSGNELEQEAGKTVFEKARSYFQKNLQGTTVHRDGVGDVRFSAKGWRKLKRGLKKDDLRAKLIPAIPDIIRSGEYHGRNEEPGRTDGIVAFHYFDGYVDLAGGDVQVGVTVAEDAFGNLFYNLNQDADKLWQKKKARLLPRIEAEGGGPSSGGVPPVKYSIGAAHAKVNIVILNKQPETRHLPSYGQADVMAELSEKIGKLGIRRLIRAGIIEIVTPEQAHEILGLKEKRSAEGSNIEGFTMPDGKVYLVQGNIASGGAMNVLLHELGVHLKQLGFRDSRQYQRVLNMVKRRAKVNTDEGRAIREAMARIPADTPDHLKAEETLAYLISNGRTDIGIVRRFLAALKKFLVDRLGFTPGILNNIDLQALAINVLKRESAGGTIKDYLQVDTLFKQNQFQTVTKEMLKSTEFKQWFGKSRIRSKSGKPVKVYHGSPTFGMDPGAWAFDTGKLGRNTGSPLTGLGLFFALDRNEAMGYTAGTGNVQEFYLKIENPLITNSWAIPQFNNPAEARAWAKRQQDLNDYDGLYIQDEGHLVAFEPEQVKSATVNTGKFDPGVADVRYSLSKPLTDKDRKSEDQAIHGTQQLNAEKDGARSDSSVAYGEKVIAEIIRKLEAVSSPAVAAEKFGQKALQNSIESYRKAVDKINDPHTSIAEKQKFAASFAQKLPPVPRAKLLQRLSQISRMKRPAAQQKRLLGFLKQADNVLTDYLRREIISNIEAGTRRLKLRKDRVARGRGPELERDLRYLRDVVLHLNKPDAIVAESARIDAEKQQIEKAMVRAESEKARTRLQEKLDDIESFSILLDTFGMLGSQNFDQLISAYNILGRLIADKRAEWRKVQEIWRERNRQNREMAARDITGLDDPRSETMAEKRKRLSEERKFKGRVREALSAAGNMIQSWELMLDKISGKSGSGTLKSWLVNHFGSIVHAATRDYERMQFETHNMLMGKAAEIFGVETGRPLAKEFARLNVEQEGKVFLYTEFGKQSILLTPLQAAYWYQIAKDRNNDVVWKTFERMGVTDKTLKQIERMMGPKLKKWADWLVDEFYQEFHDDTNEVYRQVYGIDLEKNRNYVPWRREVAGKVANKEEGQGFLAGMETGSLKKGSLRERVYNVNKFQVANINDVLIEHVTDMNHFKAWAIPSREINGTFNSPEIQNFIRQNYGRSSLATIKEFQRDFIKSPSEQYDKLARLDRLRARITTAMIGANPVVFLKQLSSIPAYAADIPAAAWAKHTAYALRHPVQVAKILGKSDMMKARYKKGFERDVANAMRTGSGDIIAGAKRLRDLTMAMVALGDRMAIVAGGYAVYRYNYDRAIKQGLSTNDAEQFALAEFEKATERSQQSGNVKDLGWFQRGGSERKLFTMFMTSPASYSRQIFTGIRHLRDDPVDAGKRLFIYGVVLPMTFQAIADAMMIFGGDDDDEDRFWKNQLRAIALGPFNGLPVIRTMMEGYANVLGGNYYRNQFTPVMQAFDTSKKLVSDTVKLTRGGTERIDAGEYLMRSLWDAAQLVGYGTGIPVRPVGRMASGVYDAATGQTEHPIRRSIGYSKYVVGEK